MFVDRRGSREGKKTSLRQTDRAKKHVTTSQANAGATLMRTCVPANIAPISHNQPIFDAGCNLANRQFENDFQRVVTRGVKEGVAGMVMVPNDFDKVGAAITLCKWLPGVLYCAAGLHPNNINNKKVSDKQFEQMMQQLREKLVLPEVVALLCGVDFTRDFGLRVPQEKFLRAELKLAGELDLPVVFVLSHASQLSDEEGDEMSILLEIIKECREDFKEGLVHNFYGSENQLKQIIDLDLHVSISGIITSDRQSVTSLIPLIPKDKFFICTDAPYHTPQNIPDSSIRESKNEPSNLPFILQVCAKAYGTTNKELAEIVLGNSKQFFNLCAKPVEEPKSGKEEPAAKQSGKEKSEKDEVAKGKAKGSKDTKAQKSKSKDSEDEEEEEEAKPTKKNQKAKGKAQESDDEEEVKPKKGQQKSKGKVKEESEEEEEEEELPKPKKAQQKAKAKAAKAKAKAKEESEEEEEEEEAPKPKKGQQKKGKAQESEEEEEEVAKPKKGQQKSKSKAKKEASDDEEEEEVPKGKKKAKGKAKAESSEEEVTTKGKKQQKQKGKKKGEESSEEEIGSKSKKGQKRKGKKDESEEEEVKPKKEQPKQKQPTKKETPKAKSTEPAKKIVEESEESSEEVTKPVAEASQPIPEIKNLKIEDEESSDDVILEFACKMCRTKLFTSENLQAQNKHQNNIKDVCKMFFLEEMDWMKKGSQDEGRIDCPKCDQKLGRFDVAGISCSCGTTVVPAFKIVKSRVDVIGEAQQSDTSDQEIQLGDGTKKQKKKKAAGTKKVTKGNFSNFRNKDYSGAKKANSESDD